MNDSLSNITKETIARLCVDRKKPNRKRAFDCVLELLEQHGDQLNSATVTYMADLYRYFMPDAPAKPKTGEDWVLKSVSTKPSEPRHYLKHRHVIDGFMVACDGSRLHLAPTKWHDGYYDKAGTPLEIEDQYPDPAALLVKSKTVQPVNISMDKAKNVLVNGDTMHMTNVTRHPDTMAFRILGKCYPAKQVHDALSIGQEGIATLTATGAIMIEFDNDCKALIMPLNE